MSAPPPFLSCQGLEAGYGASQVLFGIHLQIAAGEVVSLLGRNGMGKSTTIKALVGALRPTAGSIYFAGQSTARLPCDAIARMGLAIVPEGRHVFPNLTVREHLVAFADRRNGLSDVWDLERIYSVFPRLKERQHHLGSQLSGGEQQMLAIGRAVLAQPRLLMLDEPSLGLSPLLTKEIFSIICRIRDETGTAILVVEQNAQLGLPLHVARNLQRSCDVFGLVAAAHGLLQSKNILERAHIGLVVLVVPMKAPFYAQRLPADQPLSTAVMQRYEHLQRDLTRAGLSTSVSAPSSTGGGGGGGSGVRERKITSVMYLRRMSLRASSWPAM